MLLTIAPDLKTLFLSSALSRGAFLLIFLVLLVSQSKARYLRHWTSALIASTVGLYITVEYADHSLLPLPIAFVSYSTLLGSLVTSWTGLRLFYSRAVNLWLIPLLTILPSALYVLGASLDFSARLLLPMIYAIAALAAGLALYEIIRSSGQRLLTPYLVAAAFATYFLALAVPGILILAGVLPAAIDTSSLPAILFDQASSILVYFGYIAMSGERATWDLRRQATTDPLTGVANRRGGQFTLEQMYRRQLRGRHCSVILADVDHFKNVNDTWGHEIGDVILMGVAARLGSSLRYEDYLVRWGGEEFLIILPDTSVEEAKVSAERLREVIANCPFSTGVAELSITLSLGCARMDTQDLSYEESVQRADKSLYRAKGTGRNQVC
ncbi:GGDEF domain-containing protein [Pseudomonas sp. CBMAI 2609]|uniref:diguanylate cyclase n=1 Tax=Pseudomonas flavocrustae TaxID=2991719 RepID=A0ABT6II33_9PSED|nr:GGDEF domain-containing protein [Pseudomonas sp. CBMAI 2609]MDH4764132.1 GGDEF domain-containing protein [Pseudomonas sp. CBMAI 2609]